MKNLRAPILCACFILSAIVVVAQQARQSVPLNEPNLNKPRLFQALPEVIPVSINNLVRLFSTPLGEVINLQLSDKSASPFTGKVVSAVSKFENRLQSVVVSSTNYKGARLTLSRITNTDGTISYTGRIVSFQHGDLYELKKRDNVFVLVKRNYQELVSE